MSEYKIKVAEGGRIVIPAECRKALEIEVGDEVIMVLKEGELRICTPSQAVKRAQSRIRQYIPEGRSLSEELIRERRAENARE